MSLPVHWSLAAVFWMLPICRDRSGELQTLWCVCCRITHDQYVACQKGLHKFPDGKEQGGGGRFASIIRSNYTATWLYSSWDLANRIKDCCLSFIGKFFISPYSFLSKCNDMKDLTVWNVITWAATPKRWTRERLDLTTGQLQFSLPCLFFKVEFPLSMFHVGNKGNTRVLHLKPIRWEKR